MSNAVAYEYQFNLRDLAELALSESVNPVDFETDGVPDLRRWVQFVNGKIGPTNRPNTRAMVAIVRASGMQGEHVEAALRRYETAHA